MIGGYAVAVAASAPTTWTEQKVSVGSELAPNYFGYAIAVSGATALVGAPRAKINGHDQQGTVYVYRKENGTWTQTQVLTASDGAAGAQFGSALAISGDTALIGAYGANVNGHAYQGAVYVFHASNGTWTQTQKLTVNGGKTGSLFGLALAVSGTTAIVAAPNFTWTPDPANPPETPSGAGTAYVFTESGGTWAQAQVLTGDPNGDSPQCLGTAPPDLLRNFGTAVALSGSTALIAAQGIDAGVGNIVYVFTGKGGEWCQTQRLASAIINPGNEFGSAIAISGATALIAAPGATAGGHSYQGIVYAFQEKNGVWTPTQTLSADDGGVGGLFGLGVALTGTTALVSAPDATVNGNTDQGAAYLFNLSNGLWTQAHEFTASGGAAGTEFGISLALTGKTAVLGMTPAGNAKQLPGAAYFYNASSAPPPANNGGGSFGGLVLAVLLAIALAAALLRRRRIAVVPAHSTETKSRRGVRNSRFQPANTIKFLGVVLLAAGCVLPATTLATTPAPPSTTVLRRAIHSDLAMYLHNRGAIEHVSALSLSISLHDNPNNINVTAGTLRFGGNQPVTPTTLFEVGSNTKSFTAAIILQLESEGVLTIDDTLGQLLNPAQNYPSWPSWWDSFTIKQLLNMTTGIADVGTNTNFMEAYAQAPKSSFPAARLVSYVVGEPRHPACTQNPTCWYYSNTDYSLAQLIIEKLTGETYTDEIHQRILDPLQLSPTFINDGGVPPKQVQEQMAAGYYFSTYPVTAPIIKVIYGEDVSGLADWGEASGGLIATPEVLTHWVRALWGGSVLQKTQFDQYTSLVSVVDGHALQNNDCIVPEPQGFGLGIGHFCAPQYGSIWFYEGATFGYRVLRMYFVKTDTVIAIGTNSQTDADKLTSLMYSVYNLLESQHFVAPVSKN